MHKEALVDHLARLIERDGLSRCTLLTETSGAGVRDVAIGLANLVTGGNPGRGRGEDLVVIEPGPKAASVDEARQWRHLLSRRAMRGRRAVVILDVDRLSANALNALLKTLEEPDEDTFFVLTSSLPGRIPATIRSRCTRFRLVSESGSAGDWPTRYAFGSAGLVEAFSRAGIVTFDEKFVKKSAGTPIEVPASMIDEHEALTIYLRQSCIDAIAAVQDRPVSALAVFLSASADATANERRLVRLVELLEMARTAKLERSQTALRIASVLF